MKTIKQDGGREGPARREGPHLTGGQGGDTQARNRMTGKGEVQRLMGSWSAGMVGEKGAAFRALNSSMGDGL